MKRRTAFIVLCIAALLLLGTSSYGQHPNTQVGSSQSQSSQSEEPPDFEQQEYVLFGHPWDEPDMREMENDVTAWEDWMLIGAWAAGILGTNVAPGN